MPPGPKLLRLWERANLPHSHIALSTHHHHRYLVIMPTNNPMIKGARTFKKKLSSLFQTSRPPTSSPIDMDSRSDNNKTVTHAGARWATESCCPRFYWWLPHAFPCASINCAPDTTVTEADPTLPKIPIPVSPPILNTSSEPPSMVSIILISPTALTNYCLLRMCHFQPPIANALPHFMLPKM